MKTLRTLITMTALFLTAQSFAFGGGQDDGVREARDECASELGLEKPERGSRPSQEDMEAMDECMSGKGFEKPERPPQGGRGEQDQ